MLKESRLNVAKQMVMWDLPELYLMRAERRARFEESERAIDVW